jgi:hypothetical protein
MGENAYQEYLKTFDEPISVDIDSVSLGEDSGMTGDMYIYIYRINQYAIRSFTIVNCPSEDKNQYDFIPKPKKNWKQTKLKQHKKQVAIYYSQEPPTEIKYYFNKEKDKMKIIMGPRCSTKPKPFYKKGLYQGPKIKEQPWYINSLLRYRVFNVDKKTNELTIRMYYSADIDSETFTVSPLWMRKYFNPKEGTDETVNIPLTEVLDKIIFSVYTNRATEYKLSQYSHDNYRDTDFFYFKKAKKKRPAPLMKRQIQYKGIILEPVTASEN